MRHRLLMGGAELSVFAISGTIAFLLRFEFTLTPVQGRQLLWAIPIWIVVKGVVFHMLRLDRTWWRHFSIHDAMSIGIGNVAGSAASVMIIPLVAPAGFSRSVYLLDLLICIHLTGGLLVIPRLLTETGFMGRRAAVQKRVLIHGTGKPGIRLLEELRANPDLGVQVRGFTDDDPKKRGLFIQGVPVVGPASEIPAFVAKWNIEEVLMADPSASGSNLLEIVRHCRKAHVRCKTIPGLTEVIQGSALIKQTRDVAVEDLLGRTPIHLDISAIRAKLENKVVVVTGAAGSIGSELCRQLITFRPRAIVAYEIAESSLFYLQNEFRERFPEVPFLPVIGNIQHAERLAEAFERHSPSIMYHAAAYKHVPMMESHVFEAVENNVLGTWNVVAAAALHGLTDFVMISSDKAVRPTSIMGLTKHVSELVVNSYQNGRTKFVSVRFGNVLGSNGSVVPVFKDQIARGGPVTVTHPEMRRYFMTIPEAAQLVLQASAMGKGGEIFVLDMGQPVRIVDLAMNLIALSGLDPGEDVKIEFTGIRPGERLCEELCTLDENTRPTYHEKVKIYEANGMPFSEMAQHLGRLRDACLKRQFSELLFELKDLVPEYNPSSHILRQWMQQSNQTTTHVPSNESSMVERPNVAAASVQ